MIPNQIKQLKLQEKMEKNQDQGKILPDNPYFNIASTHTSTIKGQNETTIDSRKSSKRDEHYRIRSEDPKKSISKDRRQPRNLPIV